MSRFDPVRLLRQCVAALALVSCVSAHAASYTDLWWNPSESGWGVNVVQSDDFMFLTFFIYGADHKPTWYTASLNRNSNGTFSGGLYLTGGSYYAVPWNPADAPPAQQAGTAQFIPSNANNYQATLVYVVDNVGTVTKAIERQTLTPIALGGSYTGGIGATQSGCNNSGNNGSYRNTYDLQVSVTSASVATFTFAYSSYSCRLQGKLMLHGSQYTVDDASYTCTQNNQQVFSSTADMSEIKATPLGIEGRWNASVGNGCQESAQFSAVLL